MASRYQRSRTPDPDLSLRRSAMSPVPASRTKIASMKSAGTWGSMSNLDQILNNLQESIQQKTRECCNSYESLDQLDSDDEVSPRAEPHRQLPVINLDAPSSPKEQKSVPFRRKDKVSSQYTDQVLFRAPKSTLPPASGTGSGGTRDFRRNTVHGIDLDLSGNSADLGELNSSSRTESSGSNLTKWRSAVGASDGIYGNLNDRTSPMDIMDGSTGNDNTPPPSVFAHGLSTRGVQNRDRSPPSQSVRYEYSGFTSQQARNQFNSHDMNNNSAQSQQQQQSYSPRFTKNPASRTARQSNRVFPSITRSRSGAESPVAIKNPSTETTVDTPSSPEVFIPTSDSSFTPIQNGLLPRSRQDLPSESSLDVTSLSSEPVSTYSRSASESSISLSTPRSRWGHAEIGHSELMEISSLADPVTPEPSPSLSRKETNVHPKVEVSGSSKKEVNSLDITKDLEHPVAPPRRNHLSPTRKMWDKPKGGVSPFTQSLHPDKQGEETPNKSLAFYVPYSEDSEDLSPGAMFNNSYAKPKGQRDIEAGDEDDENSVKFPQWVIPFIDDKLSGQFEYDGKNVPMKKRSRSMPPARSVPPNHSRNITSPSPQQTRSSGPRESRSRAPARSNPPQTPSSTPVAPPRTRKLNTDTSRGKPAAKSGSDPRSAAKTDQPRKKLPVTPTTQSKASTPEIKDESELFPIHYVQHPTQPTAPTRSKTKSATSSPRNPPVKSTPSRSGPPPSNLSRFSTRGDSDSSSRSSSSLASRRSKSMGNLSLISAGDRTARDKTRPTGKDSSIGSRAPVSRTSKTATDSNSSGSRTIGNKPAAQTSKNQTSTTSSRRTTPSSSRLDRVQSTSSEDSRDRKPSTPSKSSVAQGRPSRASSATRLNADTGRSVSAPKDKTSPASSKPEKSSTLTPARLRAVGGHRQRESSESESSNSVYSEGRTSSRTASRTAPRTPVRSLSRQDSDSSSGTPDHSTFTLPRRRSQLNDSTHEGGYATLRPSRTSTPKKSILKTSTVPPSIPERETPGETSRSGRRALPKLPQDIPSPVKTPTSSRLNHLSRSTSREDVPAKPKTNLTKNRAKSMENLSVGLTSRTRPKSSSRPTSPATNQSRGGDSLRVRPRSPVLPSGHVISDRFRRLMDGDVGQAQGQGQIQGQAAQNDSLNVEKENSFDSGVEFTMHL